MKYSDHPGISAMKNKISGEKFKFSTAFGTDIVKEIKKTTNKAPQSTDIPLTIIKKNANIFGGYLCEHFDYFIKKGAFPDILKHAMLLYCTVLPSKYTHCQFENL